MKKQVKIIGGAILGLLAAGGVATSVMAPLPIGTTTLAAVTAKVTFTEQGGYLYDRSFIVYPQISGEVLEILVEPGDSVKKGDVIAVVSASDYEYQIKALKSNIAGYNAQINNLHTQEQEAKDALMATRESLLGQIAGLDVSLQDYDMSQESLDRQIEIQEEIIAQNEHMVNLARSDLRQAKIDYDAGLIEQAQYNAFRAAYTQAQSVLEASRQQLEQMKAGNATRESFLTQRDALENQLGLVDERIERGNTLAMRQYYNAMIEGTRQNIESMNEKLGQATVVAPMDGVIDKLPIRDSNIITQSSQVATICANPVIEVFVPIREIDAVRVGDTVELIVDKRLGNESTSATVIEIEDEAQIRVSALGVEERKVRVLLKPGKNNLRIGYAMDVKFTVFEQPDTIIIPKTAVFEKDGNDMVWIVENKLAQLRQIEKGVETRDGYSVKSGLQLGEVIITDANTEGLKEGKAVKEE